MQAGRGLGNRRKAGGGVGRDGAWDAAVYFKAWRGTIAQWLRAGTWESDHPSLTLWPLTRCVALRNYFTSLHLSFFICIMGLPMATIVRIEIIYINDLALCLTHSQCFQTVVVIIVIIIVVSSNAMRHSLGSQRGLEASPLKLWLGQISQSQSNISDLPVLRPPPQQCLRSLWPG